MSAPAAAARGAAVRFPVPPLLFAVPLAAGLLTHRLLPLPLRGRPVTAGAGVALVAGGIGFSLSGTITVLRHRTTVVPHHPVTRLVTSGPYRISRNPMYAGHVVACVGAALWAGSWWPLIVLPLSVLATRQWVIGPEEEYLAQRFAAEYERYRSHVRRWI
jgi:protein-S-isoprenylcysteine O-methyltransferase Ste14